MVVYSLQSSLAVLGQHSSLANSGEETRVVQSKMSPLNVDISSFKSPNIDIYLFIFILFRCLASHWASNLLSTFEVRRFGCRRDPDGAPSGEEWPFVQSEVVSGCFVACESRVETVWRQFKPPIIFRPKHRLFSKTCLSKLSLTVQMKWFSEQINTMILFVLDWDIDATRNHLASHTNTKLRPQCGTKLCCCASFPLDLTAVAAVNAQTSWCTCCSYRLWMRWSQQWSIDSQVQSSTLEVEMS